MSGRTVGVSAWRAVSRTAYLVGLPLALVALWWLASDRSTSYYWPPLRVVLDSFPGTWFTGRLTHDVVPSLIRLGVGYATASVLGISLGVVLGSSRSLRAAAEPVLEFFRAVPPPVMVPILILLTGIGNTMKVLVIIFGAFWPILLNTVEGVRGVDEVLADTARCYRVRGPARLRYLVLPSAGPQIVTGMHQALSIGIILMVISEMVAASNGLGFAIVQFQRSFAIPEMWGGIILLGALGFGLAMLFQVVQGRALRWYHGVRKAQRGGG